MNYTAAFRHVQSVFVCVFMYVVSLSRTLQHVSCRTLVWPHHVGATPVALASGSETGGLQNSHLGLGGSLVACQ